MLMGLGLSCTNSMPRIVGNERTNMRPWAWRRGLSASQTSKVCFTFLPSAISSLPRGKASRSSRGPFWPRAMPATAKAATVTTMNFRSRRRVGSGIIFRILGFEVMAVIVAEFHPACKIETGDKDPLIAREAGRRPEAETARFHAIDSVVSAQRFHSTLGERIHGALVVAQGRKHSLLAFEEDRDVGAQRVSACTLGHTGNAEHDANAPAFAARGPADAHANAISRRARPAFALHLCVFPVEVQFERTSQSRAKIPVARDEAAGLCGGRGRQNLRRILRRSR